MSQSQLCAQSGFYPETFMHGGWRASKLPSISSGSSTEMELDKLCASAPPLKCCCWDAAGGIAEGLYISAERRDHGKASAVESQRTFSFCSH